MQNPAHRNALNLVFQKVQGSSQSVAQLVEFYEELESLMNIRNVRAARHILDNKSIVILANQEKNRYIAQIAENQTPKRIVRLFPNINYCSCEYFRIKVLQWEADFTCEHVLALRLLYALTNYCTHYETLEDTKFDLILKEHLLHIDAKVLKRRCTMLTQSEYKNYKFISYLDNIKGFAAGMRALNFGEHGYFQINEDGFRCTVEHGKCIQANLFVMPLCFTEFHVNGVVNFTVDMNVLTEFLNIFTGIDCGVRMFYKEDNEPLVIILEPHDEDDITTECSIKTTHQIGTIDFSLDESSATLNTVFIRGPDLLNLLNEFDKSTEELEITLSPRKPYFKLDSLGVVQSESSIEVAKSSDMIILFNCKTITKAKYKSSLIRMAQKAMSVASKVAIKTDSNGLLEMHIMMQDTDQAEMFIQFYITPLIEMEL